MGEWGEWAKWGIVTIGLGVACALVGKEIGKGMSQEDAAKWVADDKAKYSEQTIPSLLVGNIFGNGLISLPIIGPVLGAGNMLVKGITSSAYGIAGEPVPADTRSVYIEFPAIILAGAEGMRSSAEVVQRKPINWSRKGKILAINSVLLVPAAVLEKGEIDKWLG